MRGTAGSVSSSDPLVASAETTTVGQKERVADRLITTIVAGIMFLPERADLLIPGMPPLDKEEVASLAALLGFCPWRAGMNSFLRVQGQVITDLVFEIRIPLFPPPQAPTHHKSRFMPDASRARLS